jgi:hypothetical protein
VEELLLGPGDSYEGGGRLCIYYIFSAVAAIHGVLAKDAQQRTGLPLVLMIEGRSWSLTEWAAPSISVRAGTVIIERRNWGFPVGHHLDFPSFSQILRPW